MNTEGQEILLTRDEVAEVLKLSRDSVRRLVAKGELDAVRFGKLVRFRPADVTALIDRKKKKQGV